MARSQPSRERLSQKLKVFALGTILRSDELAYCRISFLNLDGLREAMLDVGGISCHTRHRFPQWA
jgi:hypothetical protein